MSSRIFSKNKEALHDFIQVNLRYYYILLIGLLIFTILIPVSNVVISQNSIFNINYTHDQLKFRFFLLELTPVVVALSIIYGAIIGLTLFRFLNDKKEISVFFSLGISRSILFLNRILTGSLMIFLGIMIPMIISLALNIKALGITPGIINYFIVTSTGLLLVSMISMMIASISRCIAGTKREALIYLITFISFITAIFYGINGMMKRLLLGNVYGVSTYLGTNLIEENLVWKLSYINPLLFLYRTIEKSASFYREIEISRPPSINLKLHFTWFIILSLLTIIGFNKINSYKAENSEIPGYRKSVDNFASIIFTFTIFAICIESMWMLGKGVTILSSTLVTLLSFSVFQIVLFKSNIKVYKKAYMLAIHMGINCICFLIISSGGLGYVKRIPPLEKIESAEISYVGSPNYIEGEPSGTSSGKNYYITKDYIYSNKDDVKKITKIHRDIIERPKIEVGLSEENFNETVVPYDIKVKYKFKNDKEELRYYDRVSLETLETLLTLDDTNTIKDKIYNTVIGNNGDANIWASGAFKYGEIYLSDSYYFDPHLLKLSTEKRGQLQKSIALDIKNQTVNQRYFSNKQTTGVIMFSQNGQDDSERFSYSLQNSMIYINEDFENTNLFLKENELDSYIYFDKANIDSFSAQKYNPFSGINKVELPVSSYFLGYKSTEADDFWTKEDFGKRPIFVEQEEIDEIIPLLKNNHFMSDGGYLVCIKLKGENNYTYKYLPKEIAPEFIKKRLD